MANTVFLFAAAGLSVLFLFQRRREAAVLRVLGVGCVSVRLMLALELLTVDLAGVLLGTGMAAVLSTDGVSAGSMSAVPLAAGCCLAGCLIGITAGVVMVTARRPLELLNVKE